MKRIVDNLKSMDNSLQQAINTKTYLQVVMFIATILGFCNFLWINVVVTSCNRKQDQEVICSKNRNNKLFFQNSITVGNDDWGL